MAGSFFSDGSSFKLMDVKQLQKILGILQLYLITPTTCKHQPKSINQVNRWKDQYTRAET